MASAAALPMGQSTVGLVESSVKLHQCRASSKIHILLQVIRQQECNRECHQLTWKGPPVPASIIGWRAVRISLGKQPAADYRQG